ncbi:hypothetical protein OBE_05376 [human gut metagenome]|jgi:hypothetical protein|uniref:Uncharacterized protein n=1 Tax=human gut metagenome TaxID=408170 RepID=K1S3P8_9ZZZZ
MTYNIILTPEQEYRRSETKKNLESLKFNPICYNCKKFCGECEGTTCKVWDGCVYKEKGENPSVYALAPFVAVLIKNEDFDSFDGFLEELRNNRTSVVEWLESRVRGEHFKNEVLTEKYITACKKILEILKEA